MHIYLISLNANDLPLNVWPPECVFHDTDPFQLLRSNFHLPMDSVVGNGIGEVIIYTSHERGTSFAITYSLIFSGKSLNNLCYLRPHQTDVPTSSQAQSDNLKQFLIHLLAKCQWTVYMFIVARYILYQWTKVYLYVHPSMSEMPEENEHNEQRRRPMTNEEWLFSILYDMCNIASIPRDLLSS